MSEKLAVGVLVVFYFFVGVCLIRQELINEAQAQKNEVILQEIADLKKQSRINAADVDFLEKLIIEGKQ